MERRVGLCAALAALTVLLIHRQANQRKPKHPPSPASLPLLGNLLSIPPGLDHLAYIKIGEELNSDIIYLELLGNEIIVLNSAEAASDLLDKRSALYSDRFCPPMLKEPDLFDWSNNFGMSGYNDLWRHYRRMMNKWLNSQAVTQFNDLQERQTRLLLRQLLTVSGQSSPFERVKKEFFFAMASSMFQLAYGYRLNGRNDPFFVNLLQAMNNGMNAVMLSNFYVNLFPALARVPDWFPGTRWKQTIHAWRDHKDQALDAPYEWTRSQVEAGVAEPSVIGSLLQEHSLTEGLSIEERDRRLKELGMATFAGGTDTTANTFVCFVAAMVMNPHIQAKAQHEIDTVLGPNTLPTLADRARLPYVNRLILEVSRWHPVSPTAIPHVCLQDDVYRGYDISKGTVVIGNLWAISRDERFYPNPDTFDPDRFLDKTVPPFPVFGWGRRICPGLHFGEASLFITISSLLSAFTFFKKKDEFGKEIEPKLVGASNAVVLELEPFEFDFKPRSDGHRLLIQDST